MSMQVDDGLILKQVVLENQFVRLRMLPEAGSKITSLVYLPDNREFLLQPDDPSRPPQSPGYGAPFSDFDNGGFDECLPTVAACRYPGSSFPVNLPAHGEVWSVPWEWDATADTV